MSAQGTLFIISAPSGGGKTSLVNALTQQIPQIEVSISHTTRAPRVGEAEGKNYFFVDEESFKSYQIDGLFLEYAKVFDHWYGTSRPWVMDKLNAGIDVILEIDWQGARRIKQQMDCVTVFILPPSREILLERLKSRRQDSAEIITSRMNQAHNEISHYDEYDFVIVNDTFDSALADLSAIVLSQRLTIKRQKEHYAQLISTLVK